MVLKKVFFHLTAPHTPREGAASEFADGEDGGQDRATHLDCQCYRRMPFFKRKSPTVRQTDSQAICNYFLINIPDSEVFTKQTLRDIGGGKQSLLKQSLSHCK